MVVGVFFVVEACSYAGGIVVAIAGGVVGRGTGSAVYGYTVLVWTISVLLSR